ncbi:hypothetical protein M758_1G301800 [Ceratodon purpureus]|nr:hypothetical protein M758_1G301800 [Ceratodon purpureus]
MRHVTTPRCENLSCQVGGFPAWLGRVLQSQPSCSYTRGVAGMGASEENCTMELNTEYTRQGVADIRDEMLPEDQVWPEFETSLARAPEQMFRQYGSPETT